MDLRGFINRFVFIRCKLTAAGLFAQKYLCQPESYPFVTAQDDRLNVYNQMVRKTFREKC